MKKIWLMKISVFVFFCTTCIASVCGLFSGGVYSEKMAEVKACELAGDENGIDALASDLTSNIIENPETSIKDFGISYCSLSYTSDLVDGGIYTNITRPSSEIAYGTSAVWEIEIDEGYMIDEVVFTDSDGGVLCKIVGGIRDASGTVYFNNDKTCYGTNVVNGVYVVNVECDDDTFVVEFIDADVSDGSWILRISCVVVQDIRVHFDFMRCFLIYMRETDGQGIFSNHEGYQTLQYSINGGVDWVTASKNSIIPIFDYGFQAGKYVSYTLMVNAVLEEVYTWDLSMIGKAGVEIDAGSGELTATFSESEGFAGESDEVGVLDMVCYRSAKRVTLSVLSNNSAFSNCSITITFDGKTTILKQSSGITFNTSADSIYVEITDVPEGYVVSYEDSTTLMLWRGEIQLVGSADDAYLCQFIVAPLEKTYELYSTNDSNKFLFGSIKLTYGKDRVMFAPAGSTEFVELAKNSILFDKYSLKGLSVSMLDGSILEESNNSYNFIDIDGLNITLTDTTLVYKMETADVGVDFIFCLWQMNIRVVLDNAGTMYVGGTIEYGTKEMLLNSKVDSVLLKAFVSVRIGNDSALNFDIESDTINPEVVETKYKYILDEEWRFLVGTGYANDTYLVDGSTIRVVAVFATATFEATFLDTNGAVLSVCEVMYYSLFDFASLSPAEEVYGFDFYGWIPRVGDEDYTTWSEDISNDVLRSEIQWMFDDDMVFVAVEKVRESVVTLNPNGGSVVQGYVDVYYGQGFVHDDKWVPSRAGYDFVGYFDSASGGVKVLGYDSGTLNIAGGVWAVVEDVELFAQWELVIYDLDVYVNGVLIDAYSQANISVEADTVEIDFSASKTEGLYTSDINYNGGESVYSNMCNLGVLAKDDISSYVVKVAEAVPVSGKTIIINITLDKYIYFMSFDIGFFDKNHSKINTLVQGLQTYYLAEHGSAVSEWQVCDKAGTPTGAVGWVNVNISYMAHRWVFSSEYVAGLGLRISIGGVIYAFKGWQDSLNNPVSLSAVATSNLAVYTYFDNNYDVNVEYYVKNTVGEYVLVQKTGTFVDVGAVSADIKLCNTFECFLMDGEIAYISGWNFIDGANEQDCELNEIVELDARSEAYKFYAIYTTFIATFTTNNDASACVVNIPNDYYGNSYSENDVVWDDTSGTFIIYAKDELGELTNEVYCILKKV